MIDLLSASHIQVIHEALRLANIAPVVFRKAKQDVQIKGMHLFFVTMFFSTKQRAKFSTYYAYLSRDMCAYFELIYACRLHYTTRIKDHDLSICSSPESQGLRGSFSIQSVEMEGTQNSELTCPEKKKELNLTSTSRVRKESYISVTACMCVGYS